MEVPTNLEVDADNLDAVNAALSEEASKFGFEFIDASQLFCSERLSAWLRRMACFIFGIRFI